MRADGEPAGDRRDRGQTTLDFAIGVGVFLLVIAFVLTSVPNLLEPFDRSVQDDTVAADRIADHLTEDLLGSPDAPYVFDHACTIAFFENESLGGDSGENTDGDGLFGGVRDDTTGNDLGCRFDDVPLPDRVRVGSNNDVQVRLVRDLTTGEADDPDTNTDDDVSDVLCLDANNPRIIESGDATDDSDGDQCDIAGGDDDVLFAVGDSPPDGTSTAVARRTILFEGGFADGTSDATLIVEVW
ncbi:MAG: hypothetical protein ABEI11_03910 [Haloarculaceae archaeon]